MLALYKFLILFYSILVVTGNMMRHCDWICRWRKTQWPG